MKNFNEGFISETSKITELNFTDIIRQAPNLQEPSELSAPFKDHKDNTDITWKYIPNKEVEKYLQNKLFFDTSKIPFEDKEEVLEVHRRYNEDAIEIPIKLIVYAAGFVSWSGRSKNKTKEWVSKFGREETSSLNVIKHYAGLSTKIPEVGTVNMYIQPDGKIFFSNGPGDSHRIAASVLRGENIIEARHLYVYKLAHNYL